MIKEIKDAARLMDLNRPIGHIPKVERVPRDATTTIPEYVRQNPHLVVSLLYLDFDLFEPLWSPFENSSRECQRVPLLALTR